MTGSAVWGQIKMSSLSAHFHSHLSADLWEARRANTVRLFGLWWAWVRPKPPIITHIYIDSIIFQISHGFFFYILFLVQQNRVLLVLICCVWFPSPPPHRPSCHWLDPPPPPMQWLSVLVKTGTACQGKGVWGAPRGCDLHSAEVTPYQLGFSHGWCVLKTCCLLCLMAGLSEAAKCSHFSLLVACFFRCCVDRSVNFSLFQGGKSTLLSLPRHWFPGYVFKDKPAVVSACLRRIRLANSLHH